MTKTNSAKVPAAFLPFPHITLLKCGNFFLRFAHLAEAKKAVKQLLLPSNMDYMLIPGIFVSFNKETKKKSGQSKL